MLNPPLPVAPSIDQVDSWLKGDLGFNASIIGSSFQGRDILLYSYDWSPEDDYDASDYVHDNDEGIPVILFISLVHGDEVMGLLSLLRTAQMITESSELLPKERRMRLLFLPFVNIDAYTINRHDGNGGGCRRTNLRPTCNDAMSTDDSCWGGGVDLNRNHPADWEFPIGMTSEEERDDWREWSECYDECGTNYHGEEPWSELESRAIRDVVLNNNVTAALSFHSRHRMEQLPLLIHPYTAQRPFSSMAAEDRKRFRAWSKKLNEDDFYITGTALEAIQYTAGGSTIDWMYAVGVISFVLEVVPPCEDRWCASMDVDEVWQEIERYGRTGYEFILLAIESDKATIKAAWLVFILGGTVIIVLGWFYSRHRRQARSQAFEIVQNEDPEDQEVEMETIT